MVEYFEIKNKTIYDKIKQLSNKSKFKIIEATQDRELDITELSKISKIAFNKCSNYCTQLEKEGLIEKNKRGINTLVKSKIILKNLDKVINLRD